MRAIIPATLKKRISDQWGMGHFGSPRGQRTHNGQDYICPPDYAVLSPVDGVVTKHGQPYKGPEYKYIQITDSDGYDHRLFYAWPTAEVGKTVAKDDIIGIAQDLDERYPGITPHVHYEIMKDGIYFDPEKFHKNE